MVGMRGDRMIRDRKIKKKIKTKKRRENIWERRQEDCVSIRQTLFLKT